MAQRRRDPLIRPAARDALWRWREVAMAAAGALAGLWLIGLGGLLLVPLGLALAAVSAGMGVLAWRRMRFHREVDAPGLVEVTEGQVGYLGPTFGGYVALADLADLRLVRIGGRAAWRLRQTDGQTLLIPAEAQGADALFDAFAALPGLDTQALVSALDARDDDRVIWRRVRPALT